MDGLTGVGNHCTPFSLQTCPSLGSGRGSWLPCSALLSQCLPCTAVVGQWPLPPRAPSCHSPRLGVGGVRDPLRLWLAWGPSPTHSPCPAPSPSEPDHQYHATPHTNCSLCQTDQAPSRWQHTWDRPAPCLSQQLVSQSHPGPGAVLFRALRMDSSERISIHNSRTHRQETWSERLDCPVGPGSQAEGLRWSFCKPGFSRKP